MIQGQALRRMFNSRCKFLLRFRRPLRSSSYGNSRYLHTSILHQKLPPQYSPGTFSNIKKHLSTSQLMESPLTTEADHIVWASENATLTLPYLWLRDHCRCDVCYNHSTNQKNILIQDIDAEVKPMQVDLYDSGEGNGEELTLTWPDGHITRYSLPWLLVNAYPGPKREIVPKLLWNKDIISNEELPRVDFNNLLKNDDGLKDLLRSLLKYGIGLVDGVPANLDATKAAAERVCFIQRTMFGDMWSFTADGARGDTAYTNLGLGAHTDNTYLSLPAGIQVFHCIFHDGSGGETLLVDGFNVAEDLRATDPVAFRTLCKVRIHHENAEKGHHVRSLDTILRVHPVTNTLENIRYNQYDRAPLCTVPAKLVNELYSSIGKLGSIISRPENEFWIKLRPGTVLFVDNWRVMHGRAGFTGNRRINGCYLPRDDWIGKARLLGLVHS